MVSSPCPWSLVDPRGRAFSPFTSRCYSWAPTTVARAWARPPRAAGFWEEPGISVSGTRPLVGWCERQRSSKVRDRRSPCKGRSAPRARSITADVSLFSRGHRDHSAHAPSETSGRARRSCGLLSRGPVHGRRPGDGPRPFFADPRCWPSRRPGCHSPQSSCRRPLIPTLLAGVATPSRSVVERGFNRFRRGGTAIVSRYATSSASPGTRTRRTGPPRSAAPPGACCRRSSLDDRTHR